MGLNRPADVCAPAPSRADASPLAQRIMASTSKGNTSPAVLLLADGTVFYDGVSYAFFAPRPALYLKSSILVSIETEEEQKSIRDYTDTELMDELYRRRRASYDPD